MERPVIVIGENVIEMPTPKARLWRELIKFEEERKALTVEDFCDAHIEMLARAFGVSADEICDSLRVDEVLPLYMSVLKYIMALLTAKLTVSKKNEPEEGAVQD